MGMKRLFQNAAVTALKVAGDITEKGTYLEKIDNGFGDTTERTSPLNIIYDDFKDGEASRYSFGNLIQLKDVKGLVPSLSVSIPIIAQQKLKANDGTIYTIIGRELDPAHALYILLLRKV